MIGVLLVAYALLAILTGGTGDAPGLSTLVMVGVFAVVLALAYHQGAIG